MQQKLENQIIYQIYTRNFTEKGDFASIKSKFSHLKELNVDILYLMPINTIGLEGRKGNLGSPYSISNYLEINPELGTLRSFKKFIKDAHENSFKVMIDIVFNHTSRDSWILKNHPEWMYKNSDGNFANKVGDWYDVYDLNLNNPDLRKYLIDVLKHYIKIGVDGFRFDVISLLPLSFIEDLNKLKSKYPEIILLGEAVDMRFNTYVRRVGFNCVSDSELYERGFDLTYQYTSFPYLKDYLQHRNPTDLCAYKTALFLENPANPKYFLKIRGIENHDQPRIFEFTHDYLLMKNLYAFNVLMKGPIFMYNGVETKSDHRLNLFEKDTMNWDIDHDWLNFIKTVNSIKKSEENIQLINTEVQIDNYEAIIYINYYSDGSKRYGIFSLTDKYIEVSVKEMNDGTYFNLLSNNYPVRIKNGSLVIREPLYLIDKID